MNAKIASSPTTPAKAAPVAAPAAKTAKAAASPAKAAAAPSNKAVAPPASAAPAPWKRIAARWAAFSAVLLGGRALGAIAVDVGLVGSGLAAAAGSVVFAGTMLAQSEHLPSVNGVEYLAIFAQPNGGAKAAQSQPAPVVASAGEVDMSPVGAVARPGDAGSPGYELVAADPQHAWVRHGWRIISVSPGDAPEGLGRVASIVRRDGAWALIGDTGAPLLLTREARASAGASVRARAPFARSMIFGSEN